MARFLAQSLKKLTTLPPKIHQSSINNPILRFTSIRSQSNQSTNNKSDILDSETTDPDLIAFRRIEDAIHRIIVSRAAPDWLPFVPGASYYAPPRSQTDGIAALFGKFTYKLSEDEALSLTTERGWPSSAYYTRGKSPHPIEIDIISSNDYESENDE